MPVKTRRRSRSAASGSQFAYGDPRDFKPQGRRKITFWQALTFILVLVALIGLGVLVLSNQPEEREFKKAFDVLPF